MVCSASGSRKFRDLLHILYIIGIFFSTLKRLLKPEVFKDMQVTYIYRVAGIIFRLWSNLNKTFELAL